MRLPVVIIGGVLALTLAVVPGLAYATSELTRAADAALEPAQLPDELPIPDERSVVLAADGSVIGRFIGAENRAIVTLDRISEHMIDATVATEDADFFEHNGVDHQAVVRALVENVREGGIEQGGSTITQQYVKNALLSPKKTLQRKLTEISTAVQLEAELSKDEILERYLNLTYFGNGNYGVEAAAQFYFDTSARDLEVHEAALLAGLIRVPEDNEPIDNPRAAKQRRDIVIDQMAAEGYVTADEARTAKAQPVEIVGERPATARYPFVVEYVKQLLLNDPALGETRADRARIVFGGGLTIRTTIQPHMQDAADAAVDEFLTDPVAHPLGGIVSIEPGTGKLVAMGLGPRGFGECPPDQDDCGTTKVNPLVPLAGGSGRQLGSAFKPILDVTALKEGFGTDTTQPGFSGTTIPDERCETNGEKWEVSNYNRGGPRFLDMPEAIRTSNNAYHAHLIADVGIDPVIRTARSLGIESPLPRVCSLALGSAEVFPVEVAEAYATLAARGVHCDLLVIEEITDSDGEVVQSNDPVCERVLEQETVDTLTTMLEINARRGTGRARANLPRADAGKTGTTQDWRDAWYTGYVPQLAAVAWVGYEDPVCQGDDVTNCGSMLGVLGFRRITGSTVPALIWHSYMSAVLEGVEEEPLPAVDLDRGNEPPEELDVPEDDDSPSPPPPPPSPEPEPTTPPPSPDPSPTGGGTDGGTTGGDTDGGGDGGGDDGGDDGILPTDGGSDGEPSPSPSPSETTTSEPSPSPSPSETTTSEPSPSPSPSETTTSEPSPSPSETTDPSPSPSETTTSEPSPSETTDPSPSPSPSPSG